MRMVTNVDYKNYDTSMRRKFFHMTVGSECVYISYDLWGDTEVKPLFLCCERDTLWN
jgi:hypothetical protein